MLGKLQKNKNIIKGEKAITLITLVITIVLLIILAGVAINVALGQNGIFKRAKEAKLSMQEATIKETIGNIILQMQIDEIEKGGNLTLKQVAESLKIKDSNITLKEYTEGDKELKGTYRLNEQQYKFTINEKLKVDVMTNLDNLPTISDPNIESEIREGNELPFSWGQLSEISGIIENTLKDNDPNNDITNNTNEFTLSYEGKKYTIGIGDWKTVTYEENEYIVRIIGFNHDILAGQDILNEDGTLKENYLEETNRDNQISEEAYNSLNKSGISFEFTECIMTSNMHQPGDKSSYGNNTGGWANRILRTTLNGEGEGEERSNGTIDSLTEINKYVRKVTKAYGAANSSSILSYSEDNLWLLSAAEIWGERIKTYNSTKCIDGIQYKLYKNFTTETGISNNTQVIKNFNNSATNWWIRSIYANNLNPFLCVSSKGALWSSQASQSRRVAPNFSI